MEIIIIPAIGFVVKLILTFALGGPIKKPYDRPLRKNISLTEMNERKKNMHFGTLSLMNAIRCTTWNCSRDPRELLRSYLLSCVTANYSWKSHRPFDAFDEAYANCVEFGYIPDFLQWTYPIENKNYKKFEKYKKWHFLDFIEDYYNFNWVDFVNYNDKDIKDENYPNFMFFD